MSSSQKKVIVRRFRGDLQFGYLPASGFVEEGVLLLLDLEGRRNTLRLGEIKTVCYVRDFNLGDPGNPERLLRRTFLARPRGDGLWLRLTFREDGDTLEGLAASDRTLLDDLTLSAGLHLMPPDTRSNTQRIFVPHAAIATLSLLAVITSPSARTKPQLSPAQTPAKSPAQNSLFGQDELETPLPPAGLDQP